MINIEETYSQILENDPEITMPVAAIQTLVALLADVQPSTSSELIQLLQDASQRLKKSVKNSIGLSAGTDLFLRFVLRNIDQYKDWDACRRSLVDNGRLFAERAKDARIKIAETGSKFISDNNVVLVHGNSRAVNSLLLRAAKKYTRFTVYVTEAQVCKEGEIVTRILSDAGIPCCLIPDSAVAYVIDKVDKVFLGAEGVAESGGVINQIGSCQVAMLASMRNKPVYALAESHKFVRLYPLTPSDLPTEHELVFSTEEVTLDLTKFPQVDFTPHKYITALITDLGVLTPSGVSEELIKIWFD